MVGYLRSYQAGEGIPRELGTLESSGSSTARTPGCFLSILRTGGCCQGSLSTKSERLRVLGSFDTPRGTEKPGKALWEERGGVRSCEREGCPRFRGSTALSLAGHRTKRALDGEGREAVGAVCFSECGGACEGQRRCSIRSSARRGVVEATLAKVEAQNLSKKRECHEEELNSSCQYGQVRRSTPL